MLRVELHTPDPAHSPQLLTKPRQVIAPWLRGYAPSLLAGPFDVANLVDKGTSAADEVGKIEDRGYDSRRSAKRSLC